MILYNGREYQDNESIDWDTAVKIGGAYFHHAQRLGLPMPPACFVFVDDYSRTQKQSAIVGWYAALLHSTRLDEAFKRDARQRRAWLNA